MNTTSIADNTAVAVILHTPGKKTARNEQRRGV